MADYIVFNNVKDWYPPVISRKNYLKVPRISIDLKCPLPGDITDKQKGLVDKHFKAAFDGKFASMSKAAFEGVQKAMDAVEKKLEDAKKAKNLTEKQLGSEVDAVNVILKAQFDNWKKKVAELTSKCFDEAIAKSDAEMKAKIKRAKVKCILVAVLIAVVAVAAVALTIATAGAGAAVAIAVVAGIVAILGAVHKLVEGFKTSWQLCQDKITEIEGDVGELKKVFEDLTKLDLKSGDKGVVDKAKKLKLGLAGGTSNLEKHVGQLDKFTHDFVEKTKATEKHIADIKKKIADAKNQDVAKELAMVKILDERIANLKKRLEAIGEVKAAALDAKQKLAVFKVPDYPKLRKALDAMKQIKGIVTGIVSDVTSLGKSAGKLKAA